MVHRHAVLMLDHLGCFAREMMLTREDLACLCCPGQLIIDECDMGSDARDRPKSKCGLYSARRRQCELEISAESYNEAKVPGPIFPVYIHPLVR